MALIDFILSYLILSLETLGYDRGGRFYEEEDSACPALLEREFHSIHRNVPGLRRAGVDANAIRQVSDINTKYYFENRYTRSISVKTYRQLLGLQ